MGAGHAGRECCSSQLLWAAESYANRPAPGTRAVGSFARTAPCLVDKLRFALRAQAVRVRSYRAWASRLAPNDLWRCGCLCAPVRIQLFRFFGTKSARMENNKIHMNPNRTRRWPRRESKRGFSLGLAVVDATINVFITINWRCFIRVLIAVSWGGLPQTPPAPLRVHLGLAAVLYASQSQ